MREARSAARRVSTTSEGVTVRVTASDRWRVVDPRAYIEVAPTFALVYLAVQVALRDAFAATPAEEATTAVRSGLAEILTAAGSDVARDVGIEVVAVVVKDDVILPHELRAAYAEQITAKARGLAQLENARAETAALRSLANGAKLLDEHPALAKLRMIQALPGGSKMEIRAGE